MFLEEIVAQKKAETELRRRELPLAKLREMTAQQPPPLNLKAALLVRGTRIIAEVKKASPSRGVIRADFDPVAIAAAYAGGGAAAISVLTEERFFGGSLGHLRAIRKAVGNKLPLLRKDFITDPYQVYESRACGADALLLIAAALTPEALAGLLDLSHGLGMHCLVEVHNEAELKTAVKSGAGIIGINNRDLKTFDVDINTTRRLMPLIPRDRIAVSESGIRSRHDIRAMEKMGVRAVLIGEALMTSPDISAKMKELIG
jgi:indole-3-glycerol phosphate synthase